MTSSFALQLFGYAASVIIATSLLMRSIVRLRMINLAGSAMFSLYGFLVGAYPVGVLNLLIAIINVAQLYRLRRRHEIFRTLELQPDSDYLRYFLEFQAGDIRQFFPRFRPDLAADENRRLSLFVLRDLVPAGLLIGVVDGDRLEVELDYVMPQYRDLKVGRFLFGDEVALFRRRGIREIVGRADSDVHADYLRRIGFEAADDGTFRLRLD